MANQPNIPDSSQANSSKSNEGIIVSTVYPPWAKVLVFLTIVVWGSSALLFGLGTEQSVAIVRQGKDPAYISAHLKKFGNIETLPSGFKPNFAASFQWPVRLSFLTLSYEPDKSVFMLWLFPPEEFHENARQLVDSLAEKGIPAISDEFNVLSKGSLPVAGEKLEYVSGFAPDRQGKQFVGFMSCAILKDKRALLIYGWSQQDKTANEKGSNTSDNGASSKSGASNLATNKSELSSKLKNNSEANTPTTNNNEASESAAKNSREMAQFNMDSVSKLLSVIKRFQ